MDSLRLAILDMYDSTPNQGMRCIQDIVKRFEHKLDWEVFDVRGKADVPGLDFDIYISTGGPGSPHDGDGHWDVLFYEWMQSVWEWNLVPGNRKKQVFFICHSFQMAVKHFKLAKVIKRRSQSFGTFKCHMTDSGISEPLFDGLPNPFYVADFRDFQCVEPDLDQIDAVGAKIIALEKIRPHVPLERAIMGVRFSDEFIGVQFHPEADPKGMLEHFTESERRKKIVTEHGRAKFMRMIDHLNDSDKIALTHEIILPMFLNRAILTLEKSLILA